MAKTAHLTWGLSLCRLKIPSVLLDSRLSKLSLSTCSFFSVPSGLRLRSRPSLRRPCSQASLQVPHTDDIELDLVIGPLQLASQCIKERDKIATAGGNFPKLSFYDDKNLIVSYDRLCTSELLIDLLHIFFMFSDPGMRFIVYLASLALSLAALSILKLHKLLEWLTMDSIGPMETVDKQELQTKSSLISEILRAVALRYSRCNLHEYSSAPSLLSAPKNPVSNSCSQTQILCQETSTSTPTSPSESRRSSSQQLCFHARGLSGSVSEQCLLCLVRGMDEGFDGSGLLRPQQRCNSESSISSSPSSPRWPKPSRINAGICRTQVTSDTSSWCLSVELCSSSTPASEKTGLCLASAVRNGASRIWRVPKSPATHFYSHSCGETPPRRPQKLVACVAPTTANSITSAVPPSPSAVIQLSSMPHKVPLVSEKCQKPVSPAPFHVVIEETEPKMETALFTEELLALTLAAVTSTPAPPLLLLPSQETPIIRRDCGIGTMVATRDSACSPIQFSDEDSSQIGDHPDSEGLELDDEGVYFTYDYRDRVFCHEEEMEYEEIEGSEPTSHQRSQRSFERHKGEGFSDLVALTSSISDDLLQLESGCQELIQRVHANRIELDRVNDSLSFVWDYKDDCAEADTQAMEKSCSMNSSVYTHQYTPMGASMISNTGSCCACNCHFMNKDSPSPESDMLSSLTVVPADEGILHPAVSFQEDDVESLTDHQSHPHRRSSSHQHLESNSTSSLNDVSSGSLHVQSVTPLFQLFAYHYEILFPYYFPGKWIRSQKEKKTNHGSVIVSGPRCVCYKTVNKELSGQQNNETIDDKLSKYINNKHLGNVTDSLTVGALDDEPEMCDFARRIRAEATGILQRFQIIQNEERRKKQKGILITPVNSSIDFPNRMNGVAFDVTSQFEVSWSGNITITTELAPDKLPIKLFTYKNPPSLSNADPMLPSIQTCSFIYFKEAIG
ncbi:hypothetical protein Aperf_G00000078653 [Anoplocephala perfoliata]